MPSFPVQRRRAPSPAPTPIGHPTINPNTHSEAPNTNRSSKIAAPNITEGGIRAPQTRCGSAGTWRTFEVLMG